MVRRGRRGEGRVRVTGLRRGWSRWWVKVAGDGRKGTLGLEHVPGRSGLLTEGD